MSNDLHNQIRSTIRRALYSTLGIPLLALPVAMAQQATNQTAAATGEAVKTEKTVVTGSLIPTAETVGPAPVEVVGTVEIQKSGQQDILQTLKRLSTSFAGNGNVGQTINNRDQGGGEANIAIRNLPTLVLMDGRRLANSAFSQGAVVDVNTIPISMIERIEVLKDGASTLYGSDAIGGVVNIITKKNYNGAEITGRYGFPTDKTSNDLIEYRASIVAGASTEKSSLVAGVDYYHMDPLLSADRHVASASVIDLLNIGIAPPTYVSGSFPARVGDFILAGSPFAVGAPGYNPNITTPPVDRGTNYASLSSYRSAHPGVYIPIDSTLLGAALLSNGVSSRVLLNTTLLGTHSIQLQDRRNAFASFEHDLLEKKIQAFGSCFYANNHAEGKLAPSPVAALGPAGLNNIFIPANNPYNPFQQDLQGAAGEPRIRTRFIEVGNRIFDSDYNYYRFVGGLKGEITDRYRYEAAYTYNRSEQTQLTHGAVDGDSLNKALTPDL